MTGRDEWPDLTRTAAALDAFDVASAGIDAEYSDLASLDLAALDAAHAVRERAARAVGDAFALDTADRNDPETARRMRPGPWLRGLVGRWRALSAPVPPAGPAGVGEVDVRSGS